MEAEQTLNLLLLLLLTGMTKNSWNIGCFSLALWSKATLLYAHDTTVLTNPEACSTDFFSARTAAPHVHNNWTRIQDTLMITTGNSMRLHTLL